MQLSKIISLPTKAQPNISNLEIDHLAFSLDDIKPNTLFFCLKTSPKECSEIITKAKEQGAIAVVTQTKTNVDIPQILVPNIRKTLSLCSGNFYDNPAKKLKIIGITGTNGKTTSTYILKSILEANGKKVGLIGTNGFMIAGNHYPLNMTTPDPTQLHKIFARMLKSQCDYVVMEVSAHAMFFDKLEGVRFECGIFTNLTQDHLDFFKTLDAYASAKTKFFSPHYLNSAVVNVDDTLGKTLSHLDNLPKLATYGLINPADTFAVNIKNSFDGSKFYINLDDKVFPLNFAIPGIHNVQNVLACATCANMLGFPTDKIKQGIENISSVQGRFQIFKTPNDAHAVVDYAHTPDGLEHILKSAREITKGKVIAVFGCGGNRDALKRPIMGEIAGKNADLSIITSDNPRFENPEDIIKQVEQGTRKATLKYKCITDRKSAIEYALSLAKQDDAVIICGKGAEDYQEINGIKQHFSDTEIVQDWCLTQQKHQNDDYLK